MNEQGQFLLYTGNDGAVKVEVFVRDETVWLTQKAIAELFGVKRPAITKHLGNIFTSGELAEDSVSSILEHTAGDGKAYGAKYCNLDAIIAVGYRVNSQQFALWPFIPIHSPRKAGSTSRIFTVEPALRGLFRHNANCW